MYTQNNLSRQAVARGQHRQAVIDSHQRVRLSTFGPRVRSAAPAVKLLSVAQQLPVNPPVVQMVAPQPYAVPAHPKLQTSKVLHRKAVKKPGYQTHQLAPVVHKHQPRTNLFTKTLRKLKFINSAAPVLDA